MASVSTSLQTSFGDAEENACLEVRGPLFTGVADRAPPPRVECVTYAKLPCKCAPGPPIVVVSSSPRPRSASPATPAAGNHLLTAPLPLQASAPPPSSSTEEVATSSAPLKPPAPKSTASVNEKGDSPFLAAQQFLFSSGASLLHYASPSFYLSLRSGVDANGGGSGTSASCVEVLSEEGQRNLLTSSTVAAALKERYDGVGATAVSGSSTGASGGSVDWKKIDWVRQQCRYTGEALLKSSVRTAHDGEEATRRESASHATDAAAVASPPLPSASSSSTPGSTEVGEKSVGARLMQSLLYPFTQPSAPPTPAVAAPAAAVDNAVTGTVVPHGVGVMTYLLYCKPKTAGYGYPSGGSRSQTAGAGASSSPLLPMPPFLPPDLIPTAYCPPLTDIEITTAEDGLASSGTLAASPVPPVPHLLLLSLIVYEGAFVRGRRHGRGRLTAYGRMVLECTWSEDVPCLAVPWPISSAATSAASPAPTLWNVSAHVWAPAAAKPTLSLPHVSQNAPRACITNTDGTKAAEARRSPSCAPSGTWSVRATEAYMGSLMLATVASKKLLAKMEACMGSAGASLVAKAVTDLHGARYVALPVPHPWPSSDGVDLCDAFCGLGWANHVVLLPDGFGEAHFRADSGLARSAAPPASCTLTVSALGGLFQPPLWVPETSSAALFMHTSLPLPSSCWQYCGQWSAGLPHGFGAAAERLTDPTAASLASSASTAGAGPPQYPWRSLFLGQYVNGKRHGPGTYHGAQGSEATEVVLCGTWPRHGRSGTAAAAAARADEEQTAASVVLLPASFGSGVTRAAGFGAAAAASSPHSPPLSSSFFSVQCVCWSDSGADEGRKPECGSGSCGGGFFPVAKLRQSAAALSGMWEPLFRAVDDAVAGQSPTLLIGDEDPSDGTRGGCGGDEAAVSDASPSRKALLWRRACRVVDSFVVSPECVAVLSTFHACFAFMYGEDVAAVAAEEGATATTASATVTTPSGSEEAALRLLQRLESAATVASSSSAAPLMGYPWCPAHSWCAMGLLGSPSVSMRGTQGGPGFAACLHSGLSDGATHYQPPPTASRLGTRQASGYTRTACSERSANGALLRPPLSAAAAALEPFAAAHTFTHAMHAAAAFVSSLRLRLLSCFAAYPDLCEVVMGDKECEDKIVQYCWHIVFGYVGSVLVRRATAVAVADVRLVWELLGLKSQRGGKETLTDYFVALRRCRTLTREDIATVACADVLEACEAGGHSPLNECARRLGKLLELHATAASSSPVHGTPVDRISSELQEMTTFLSQLHALLGTAGKSSGRVKSSADHLSGSEGEDVTMAATFTLAQREALLRWVLFSATAGHTAVASFPSRSVVGRHPFAFLLVAHFLLSGRVIPAYPVLVGDSSGCPSRHGLLRLLTDMGRATRELMHTYPSVRWRALLPSPAAPMHVWTMSAVCPLDTLALKLEYVLSHCAALHLCASCRVHLISSGADGASPPLLQGDGEGGSGDTDECSGGAPKDSAIHLSVHSLSREAQQWCRCELTDRLTAPLLEARLQHYWDRLTRSSAQHSSPNHHPARVDGTEDHRRNDAIPPSPLMRWLLLCLQGVLSGPLQPQPVVRPSSGTAPADSASMRRRTNQASSQSPRQSCSTALPTRYTWKKFISAVFFSPAEREEWISAHSPTTTAVACALSLMDSCYVAALAYTLRELAGIELDLRVRFVFEDDDEDEERSADADRQAASEAGGAGERRGATASAASSVQMESIKQSRCARKNIFLSSSSSSSSIPLSPRAASPLPGRNLSPDSRVQRAATHAHTGGSSSRSGNGSSHGCSPGDGATAASTQSSTPTRQRLPALQQVSRLAYTEEPPCDEPPRANGRLRSQSAAVAGSVASPLMGGPVGKEWELTLVLRHGNDGGEQETAASPNHLFSTLTWEVMEQVCSTVLHQLQATAQPGDAAESKKLTKAKAEKSRRRSSKREAISM
ncbi:MORN repeat-containing protein [Leishmania donovani]|uniref:MORN_repeat-containing_protein/GeneDB:LmjF.20.110 0 n=1 Tax=Leishmania donovani TaxID=5661 RepID=A0A6J8FD37_LEIDO|nr:MORN repeat-containing protein [Leishmania donovani]VDZ44285.1 MORN_repeat-containing_protein/GeneDB:LmjF.20.1100 [Leishmania donovani]